MELLTNDDYLRSANEWAERARQHRQAAEFCDRQVARFMGKVAVPEDTHPTLTIVAPTAEER